MGRKIGRQQISPKKKLENCKNIIKEIEENNDMKTLENAYYKYRERYFGIHEESELRRQHLLYKKYQDNEQNRLFSKTR